MVGLKIIYVACRLEPDRRTKDHSGADSSALSKSDGLVSPPFKAPLHRESALLPDRSLRIRTHFARRRDSESKADRPPHTTLGLCDGDRLSFLSVWEWWGRRCQLRCPRHRRHPRGPIFSLRCDTWWQRDGESTSCCLTFLLVLGFDLERPQARRSRELLRWWW